ncbi:hypothetical protein [Micromonospora sp. NPDC003776]
MIRGVVFFDVDGTLTPTSSGQHLAEFLGYTKVIQEVQAGYGAGTLSSQEAAVLEARGWATRTPMEVRGFLKSLPLVAGISEAVLWCRRRGLAPVLATLAWDVVGAYLCDRLRHPRRPVSGMSVRLLEYVLRIEVRPESGHPCVYHPAWVLVR